MIGVSSLVVDLPGSNFGEFFGTVGTSFDMDFCFEEEKDIFCTNVFLLREMSLKKLNLTRTESALVWPDSQTTTVVWLEESYSELEICLVVLV